MPVFTIETPSGQKLDIEAADQAAALQGAQQWHEQNTPSVAKSLEQGISNVPGGIAKTLQTHLGAGPVSDKLNEAAQATAPSNYVSPSLYDKEGFHAGNIPAWLAERAPSMATAIAAARVTPGPWWAKMLGGAAAGTFMSAGNEAQTAADNRTGTPNSPVTHEDLVRGDLTAGGENLVGALPITRLLPGSGKVTATGVKGVANAVKRYGTTAALEGAAGAGSDVAHQVGQTYATPGGVTVDPTEVADQAVGNALTGGVFGAKNAVREGLNAAKYREVTPELQDAATQFANRMKEFADGRNLDAGIITGGKAQETGAEVFNKAHAAVKNELSDAVSDLRSRVNLPTDAKNVLDAAMSGQQPTEREYGVLQNAVQGDPQAANVLNLARQAHVADIVKDSGNLGDKFTGGISGKIGSALNLHNIGKTALAAGVLDATGGTHLIAYSPEMLAALGGVQAAARVADNLTGARSPAGRFVRAFGDDTTPVRQNVVQPVQPVAPAPVIKRPGPTGPVFPQTPTPWGPPPYQPSPQSQQQLIKQANLPLRALANLAKTKTAKIVIPSVAGVIGAHLAGELGGHLATHGTREAIDSFAQRYGGAEAGPQQTEQQAMPLLQQLAAQNPPVETPDLAKVITRTRALVRGLQQTQKLKQRIEGANQADQVASSSPLVNSVGGLPTIANPAAGQRMSQMVSAVNALKKLQAQPPAPKPAVAPPMQPTFTQPKAAASYGPDVAAALARAQTVPTPQQSPEKIVSAAYKAPDGSITKGAIHVEAREAKYPGRTDIRRFTDGEDGFVTSTGRFVNREEALQIAKAQDQLQGPTYSDRNLHAGDLKPTVTSVTKGNGKIETKATNGKDEYVIPSSPYAHLPVEEAANKIVKDMERAGNVKYLAGARSGTIRNLTAIRNAATGVAKEVPGVNAAEIASQFEGVRDRKQASAHREYLKQQMPQAAGALDTYFNDEVIGRIWKRKG